MAEQLCHVIDVEDVLQVGVDGLGQAEEGVREFAHRTAGYKRWEYNIQFTFRFRIESSW